MTLWCYVPDVTHSGPPACSRTIAREPIVSSGTQIVVCEYMFASLTYENLLSAPLYVERATYIASYGEKKLPLHGNYLHHTSNVSV
jgi:hypothetical protein